MKVTVRTSILFLMAVTLVALANSSATADPLEGQVLKFQQKPLDGLTFDGETYWGHNQWSTAYGTRLSNVPWGFQMDPGLMVEYRADDFADEFNTPVMHVRWCGSYQNDFLGNATDPNRGVQQFLISFEADVPAIAAASETNSFSHPDPFNDDVNLHQVVYKGPLSPSSGTFTEKWISSGGPDPPLPGTEALYEYNAELACPFPQEPNTVYWLKIVALVDQEQDDDILWGWHDRDYSEQDKLASTPPGVFPGEQQVGNFSSADGVELPVWHFQDNAVVGLLQEVQSFDPLDPCGVSVFQEDIFAPEYYRDFVDGPEGIGDFSKDLAFELYTVPEPSTLVLVGLALVAAAGYGFRERKRGHH